jgi:hypothetical protein
MMIISIIYLSRDTGYFWAMSMDSVSRAKSIKLKGSSLKIILNLFTMDMINKGPLVIKKPSQSLLNRRERKIKMKNIGI